MYKDQAIYNDFSQNKSDSGISTEGRYIGAGRDKSAPTDSRSMLFICIIYVLYKTPRTEQEEKIKLRLISMQCSIQRRLRVCLRLQDQIMVTFSHETLM